MDINDKPDNEARHQYCPRGKDSWCKYQSDKFTGESTYKSRICIPTAVREVIKPIFSHEYLGADTLLKKCLHGQTQNPNEAFNNCIWRKAPKDTFVARRTLEVAVASAVIHFNDGGRGILKVIDKCGFSVGHYTIMGLAESKKVRINAMNRKTSVNCKLRRKKLRAYRKN